jgi:hypothetical protein
LSLGGRPVEEGGHKHINLSVNAETYEGLRKIRGKGAYMSKFIENALYPLVHQLDLGDSCKVLSRIDETLKSEIISAVSKENFEMASALATIGNSLEPFRDLCREGNESGVTEFEKCRLGIGEHPNSARQSFP